MTEVVIFAVIAAVVLVVGIRVGMLVAPRLSRWGERKDESPNDD